MSLNSRQREKLTQFISITGMQDAPARKYLNSKNWDLELAVDEFYNSGAQMPRDQPAPTNQKNIESLFARYKGSNPNQIESEGIEHFCRDLGIEPMDVVILVISKYFNAATMGVYTKEEFCSGMKALGCDDVNKLRQKIPELRRELNNPQAFKEVYNYVFTFSRDPGVRNLGYETAVALWRLLLTEKYPIVNRWIEFLERREKKHDVMKDTWEMFLDFAIILEREGLQGYDPNGAWPVLIDEFVEYLRR
ncbi:unnamed protein product [Blepharisma stoltei]|uniref:Defective in cullin neddylation protein n=1 Tax=Blepharisma stoltei TaxID=1481888 RepID=A0AAU9JVR6_9CILI|nr:unnamed protein product [Blepharisma stoltei]